MLTGLRAVWLYGFDLVGCVLRWFLVVWLCSCLSGVLGLVFLLGLISGAALLSGIRCGLFIVLGFGFSCGIWFLVGMV